MTTRAQDPATDPRHPAWEVECRQHTSGDLVHQGALHVHAGPDGAVMVSRVRADEWDGGEQWTHPLEVRVERVGEGRGAEHYEGHEVEALAVLAEAQGDDDGRELAALLRDLGRDD